MVQSCVDSSRVNISPAPFTAFVHVMSVEIVKLQSGGEKLLLDGQTFYHRLHRKNRRYWKCSVKSCSATAVTNSMHGYVDVVKETPHNHIVASRNANDVQDELDECEKQQRRQQEYCFSDTESEDDDEGDTDKSDEESGDVLWMEWVEESSDEEDEDQHDDDADLVETDEKEETDEDSDTEMDTESKGTDEDTSSDDTDSEDETERSVHILNKHLKANKDKIRILRSPENYLRAAVIKHAPKNLICFLNEICLNIRRRFFHLTKFHTNMMNLFEDQLDLMVNEHRSWREKKLYLDEHADEPFIPVILNCLAESHSFCK